MNTLRTSPVHLNALFPDQLITKAEEEICRSEERRLDLPENVFINMANFTLARRDSYLDYLHAGVKQDTVNTLRTSPVYLNALFPDQLKWKSVRVRRGIRLVHHTDTSIVSTPMLQVTSRLAITTGNRPSLLGRRSRTSSKQRKIVARPQHSPRSLPRDQSLINDNHCVNSVTGQKNSVYVTSQGDLDPAPVVAGNSKVTLHLNVDFCVANAHTVTRKA